MTKLPNTFSTFLYRKQIDENGNTISNWFINSHFDENGIERFSITNGFEYRQTKTLIGSKRIITKIINDNR